MSRSLLTRFPLRRHFHVTPSRLKENKPDKRHLRIKELQKKFQVDNGCPVHLKGGPMDKVLYRLTLGLSLVGLGCSLYELLNLAFGKKK